MLTKIFIPVMNMDTGDFLYEGQLSTEEYGNMVMSKFLATDKKIDRYMNNLQTKSYDNDKRAKISDYRDKEYATEAEIKYDFFEAEAFIQDVKKNDIEKDYFFEHEEKGDMFILILNINPTSLEWDAEGEIKFWIDDSDRVLSDNDIDDDTKLKTLPKRTLKIELDGKEMLLNNCKIIQNYSDKKWPFYFAIIVEKITY